MRLTDKLFVLERTAEPDFEPLVIAEMIEQVKEFTSLSAAAEARLTALITAAREWVEDYTGRALVDQTWRLTLAENDRLFANVDSDTVQGYYRGPNFARPDGSILLRRAPVLSIESINKVNSDGTETLVAASTYELREADSKWPRVVPLSGDLSGPARIVFRAGFIDTSVSPSTGTVPERFLQAMRLYAEAIYNKDEKMMPLMLKAAEDLIRPESSNLQLA